MTHDERETLWKEKVDRIGSVLTFKFFRYGIKDKPRFPRFVGWRSGLDL